MQFNNRNYRYTKFGALMQINSYELSFLVSNTWKAYDVSDAEAIPVFAKDIDVNKDTFFH